MKTLIAIILLQIQFRDLFAALNQYLDEDIIPFCGENQQKLTFKYAIRVRKNHYYVDDSVYLFTEKEVFIIPSLVNAIHPIEDDKYVLRELMFNKVKVKTLKEFWGNIMTQKDFTSVYYLYNTAFTDWHTLSKSYWLRNDKYQYVNIDTSSLKAKDVSQLFDFTDGPFGFMRNEKIKEKGFDKIFAITFASTWSPNATFQPIRVYLKEDNGFRSYSFYNYTEVEDEVNNEIAFRYHCDSIVYVSPGRSMNIGASSDKSLDTADNHYFELRFRSRSFVLFDIHYNRDNLLMGANEELLGCPPSYCQANQFDAIVRLLNGTEMLIYREWGWNFVGPNKNVVYENAIKLNLFFRKSNFSHISNKHFDFAIRRIIDGSFIDNGILYLFRNGSFIMLKDSDIFGKLLDFKTFTSISDKFDGIPSQFYDTIFYHKLSRIVYFILSDQYWAYSMGDSQVISDDFPESIKYIGLPKNMNIKSSYVEVDDSGEQVMFYFFSENYFIVYSADQFKNGKFESDATQYYCTSTEFFGCEDTETFNCKRFPNEETESNKKTTTFVITIIIVVIIIMLATILVVLLVFFLRKKKQNTVADDRKQSDNSVMDDNSRSQAR